MGWVDQVMELVKACNNNNTIMACTSCKSCIECLNTHEHGMHRLGSALEVTIILHLNNMSHTQGSQTHTPSPQTPQQEMSGHLK